MATTNVKKFVDSQGVSHLWQKIQEALDRKANLADIQPYDDTALAARVSANEATINTLTGTGAGSIADTAASAASAAIAAVVNNAPAAFDTLKELADWVANEGGEDGANMTAAEIIAKLNQINSDLANKLESADLANYLTHSDITAQDIADWNTAVTKAHVHENADLLDSLSATTGTWHKHSNQTVLDAITAEKVAAWDALENCDCEALTNDEIDAAIANANRDPNTLETENGEPIETENGDPLQVE